MEPSSIRERTKGPGKLGSIDNPEVIDVPGHVIPILEREFDDFDTESSRFLAGDYPEAEFIGFRLRQGVYGQRQPGVQMCRVKLPWGGVTPEQMDMFAQVVEQYAPLRKGSRHDPPEHSDPPRPARPDGAADPRHQPRSACRRARAAATPSAT